MTCEYLIYGVGLMGKQFQKFLPNALLSFTRVRSVDEIRDEIERLNPLVVINAVGKTHGVGEGVGCSTIDYCESPLRFHKFVILIMA